MKATPNQISRIPTVHVQQIPHRAGAAAKRFEE